MENVKCLIIGSGPSGYTAAIYTSRANLSPVLYEGIEPGGQLTTTTEIENFPGFTEGIDGPKLMDNMRQQALRFGADIRPGVITSVDLSSRPFHVIVNGEKEIQAEALIISTGAAAKYLGLPSEEKFKGMGVSACATCDGFFYRKKDVAVVGGGDTACEEATYLASICRQVYLIVRKPYLRASKAMQERVMNTPNIKVLFEHNTAEVLGDETGVTGALLRDNKGTETKIDIAGFFVAIGHHPNTEIFADQLELDAEGYIKTAAGSSRTSVEGVSPPATCRIPTIARRLRPPVRVVWPLWTASVSCYNNSQTKKGNEPSKPFPFFVSGSRKVSDRSKPSLTKPAGGEHGNPRTSSNSCSMGFDAAVTLFGKDEEERKVSIPCNPF